MLEVNFSFEMGDILSNQSCLSTDYNVALVETVLCFVCLISEMTKHFVAAEQWRQRRSIADLLECS